MGWNTGFTSETTETRESRVSRKAMRLLFAACTILGIHLSSWPAWLAGRSIIPTSLHEPPRIITSSPPRSAPRAALSAALGALRSPLYGSRVSVVSLVRARHRRLTRDSRNRRLTRGSQVSVVSLLDPGFPSSHS